MDPDPASSSQGCGGKEAEEPEAQVHRYRYPRPGLSAHTVLLSAQDRCLHILLVKRKTEPYAGAWALPGGFVEENEDVEAAARRELKESTACEGNPILYIGTFGAPHRDPQGHTVTACYCMTLRTDTPHTPKASGDASEAQWWAIRDLPTLAFDHTEMVRACLRRLARGLALKDRDVCVLLAAAGLEAQEGGDFSVQLAAGWRRAAEAWHGIVRERLPQAPLAIRRAQEALEEAREEAQYTSL